MESRQRSLLKTITWRIIAYFITLIIAYMFMGNLTDSIVMSLSINILKMFLYYFHERFWAQVQFGQAQSDNKEGSRP